MNCFKHTKTVSVGICQACGKGLCVECARDTSAGLYCADGCHSAGKMQKVKVSADHTSHSTSYYRSAATFLLLSAIIVLATKLPFLAANESILLSISVVLCIGAAVFFLIGRKVSIEELSAQLSSARP
jgi:hypothetical protein